MRPDQTSDTGRGRDNSLNGGWAARFGMGARHWPLSLGQKDTGSSPPPGEEEEGGGGKGVHGTFTFMGA